MDGYFYNILCLLKAVKKSYLFAAQYKEHFKSNMSQTNLLRCIKLKLFRLINPTGKIKIFMKPNSSLCME